MYTHNPFRFMAAHLLALVAFNWRVYGPGIYAIAATTNICGSPNQNSILAREHTVLTAKAARQENAKTFTALVIFRRKA